MRSHPLRVGLPAVQTDSVPVPADSVAESAQRGQGSSGDKPGTDTAEKNNDTCGDHALEQKVVFGILDLVFQIRDEDFGIYIDGDRV